MNSVLSTQEADVGQDISGWRTRLTDGMIAEYTATGKWLGLTIGDRARYWASETPDVVAVVEGEVSLTYKELFGRAVTLARTFLARGLRPGHVVSFQLPNWHEGMVINIAAALTGVIVNPIVPIFRDTEVGFIMKDARTRVLFIPETLRSMNYVEMIERLRPGLPDLEHVVLVRSTRQGYDAFEDWCPNAGDVLGESDVDFPSVNANAVKLVLYTSGTTGVPKGVLHSHNTLGAELDAFKHFRALTSSDIVFMPSPITHISGYLYGLELLFVAGMKVVFLDRWNAAEAVDLISLHQATFTAAATPFLVEIVSELERRHSSLPSLKYFGCGGASVAPDAVERALIVLPNCQASRAYGATEAPSVSMGVADGDPPELGVVTDGVIVNHEVRILDTSTGAVLPEGREGEIATRGPEIMLAYADFEATVQSFDADGFFRTGDLGFISHGAYITITGRIKDIIIRGGENIAPKEIEDVLYRHPAVSEVAIVAMPHPRLGETPCAFIVLADKQSFDFEGMIAFLESHKVAKQKFPEKLIIAEELPRNAAGKVLKHVLKARLG